ncbi:MAG: DNA mismatch repair protein [Bacteroidales bacterium]
MIFKADRQTKEDLGIFPSGRESSIYDLFNRTQSNGGSKLLRGMFDHPLSNIEEINRRSALISLLAKEEIELKIESEKFDFAEFYLSNQDQRTRIRGHKDNLERKFNTLIGSDQNYIQIKKGAESLVDIFHFAIGVVELLSNLKIGEELKPFIQLFQNLIDKEEFNPIKELIAGKRLNYAQLAICDNIFRFNYREDIGQLLTLIYTLDLYITVGKIGKELNFNYAQADDKVEPQIEIDSLFHPMVKGAISNSVKIESQKNVIFLTGANMAGKSTFMKSLGIAIYLAHMGFPIPAASMNFSVMEGLFTTINLPDNIAMGYSHFYAEVMRVKRVAESLSRSKRIFVIFDELFRGTNVKDAYDATVAITKAFASIANSFFIISTHIIEAGATLDKSCKNINFLYLPTVMEGNRPIYTYKLSKGITADRHGMLIINNENILDILNS